MRSRTVNFPLACWRSTFAGPPICFASSTRRFISSTSGSQVKSEPPVREFADRRARSGLGTVPLLSRLFQIIGLSAALAVLKSVRFLHRVTETMMSTAAINRHQELIDKLPPASTLILHDIG